MKKFENIFYSEMQDSEQVLDLYLPDIEDFPVFIYFHGGGIVEGDKTNGKFFDSLVEKGIAVISANYRMYPRASYPDFLEDSAAAVAWAYTHMNEYGNPTGYYVGGSSAGGYITQMLCFDKSYLAAHGIDADQVGGYFMDAGQPTTHFNVLKERGLDSRRVIIDEAAPIFHIVGDRTYAPMFILVSDNDMENRPEQTALLVSTLKHFRCDMDRVDYKIMENSKHCRYVNAFDENGNSIFADLIFNFIKKYSF